MDCTGRTLQSVVNIPLPCACICRGQHKAQPFMGWRLVQLLNSPNQRGSSMSLVVALELSKPLFLQHWVWHRPPRAKSAIIHGFFVTYMSRFSGVIVVQARPVDVEQKKIENKNVISHRRLTHECSTAPQRKKSFHDISERQKSCATKRCQGKNKCMHFFNTRSCCDVVVYLVYNFHTNPFIAIQNANGTMNRPC